MALHHDKEAVRCHALASVQAIRQRLACRVLESTVMVLFDGVEKLRGALDYHLARQNLLTQNLSHVDTPGYRPLDLERRDAVDETGFGGVLRVAMRATDPAHIGSGSSAGPAFRVFEDDHASRGADDNGVSLDREAVKIAANNVRYEAISQLVRDKLAALEWAASDGRGA